MNTGKLVRMNRIFSHASGRLCSVAVDHFIGYGEGLPPGLRHLAPTLAALVAAAARRGHDAQGNRRLVLAEIRRPRSLHPSEHGHPAHRPGPRAACRSGRRRALGGRRFCRGGFRPRLDRGRVSARSWPIVSARPPRSRCPSSATSIPAIPAAARFRSRRRTSPGPCVARSRWAWTW